MDGSLIVILGFPVLYLTGSLRRAAAFLDVGGAAFVLYFLCTAALLLLPKVRVAQNFAINFAGLFYCFAPIGMEVRQREFPIGLPYAEGALVALIALLCIGRRAALFAPVLAGFYEAAAHTVRLISGLDTAAWMSGVCAASVAIAVCFFAGAVRLPSPGKARRVSRRASRHAET